MSKVNEYAEGRIYVDGAPSSRNVDLDLRVLEQRVEAAILRDTISIRRRCAQNRNQTHRKLGLVQVCDAQDGGTRLVLGDGQREVLVVALLGRRRVALHV